MKRGRPVGTPKRNPGTPKYTTALLFINRGEPVLSLGEMVSHDLLSLINTRQNVMLFAHPSAAVRSKCFPSPNIEHQR